jgi:hypothetical protein
VRSFHVANVTAKTLGDIMAKNVAKATAIMTDESAVYPKLAEAFAGHGTVTTLPTSMRARPASSTSTRQRTISRS